MDRIEFGFNHGYTRALMDLKSITNVSFFEDCKRHKKRVNAKTMQEYLQCAIDNREILRDNPWSFIRCTGEGKDCKFEIYVPKGYRDV